MDVFGPDDLPFEEVAWLVVEVFADLLSDVAPLIGLIENSLWGDGLGAFDVDAIRDARFLGVAWLALLGFTEDDGLFFSLGAVVFGLSRVIGVVEEEA